MKFQQYILSALICFGSLLCAQNSGDFIKASKAFDRQSIIKLRLFLSELISVQMIEMKRMK